MAKKKKLEAAGWSVVSKWECEWKNETKRAEGDMLTWLTNRNPVAPLEPRDAFFGGTNKCRASPPRVSRRGRDDLVPRRDIALPVGKQIQLLSHGSSHHHHHV